MHSNYLLEDIAQLDMFIFAWTDISTLGGFDLVFVCVQARVCVCACAHLLHRCLLWGIPFKKALRLAVTVHGFTPARLRC